MTRELTLDRAGRIELSDDLQEHLHTMPGGRLRVRALENGTIVLEPEIDLRSLKGCLSSNGVHLTIEQINEIIATAGSEN